MPNISNITGPSLARGWHYRQASNPLTSPQVTQTMREMLASQLASEQDRQSGVFERWYESYYGDIQDKPATKWVVTWSGSTPKLELAVTGSATQQEAITVATKHSKQEMTSCYKWINRYMTAAQTHKHRLASLASLASNTS